VSESTTKERGRRKAMIGTVVSTKMDKTAVVAIERRYPHPLYHKIIRSTKRYKAHDPQNAAVLGDIVRIEETRPLSKEKRWRIAETLTRGNVAEVAPREIGVPEEAMPERQAPPAPVAAAPVETPAAAAPVETPAAAAPVETPAAAAPVETPAAAAPVETAVEAAPEETPAAVAPDETPVASEAGAPSEDSDEVIDTPAEAAADEGSMHTESDVLQGAADDMDATDYGKPEEEEKP
jgi:small subunit ribosomal protein S17